MQKSKRNQNQVSADSWTIKTQKRPHFPQSLSFAHSLYPVVHYILPSNFLWGLFLPRVSAFSVQVHPSVCNTQHSRQNHYLMSEISSTKGFGKRGLSDGVVLIKDWPNHRMFLNKCSLVVWNDSLSQRKSHLGRTRTQTITHYGSFTLKAPRFNTVRKILDSNFSSVIFEALCPVFKCV